LERSGATAEVHGAGKDHLSGECDESTFQMRGGGWITNKKFFNRRMALKYQ
jgi:hypothetical protein